MATKTRSFWNAGITAPVGPVRFSNGVARVLRSGCQSFNAIGMPLSFFLDHRLRYWLMAPSEFLVDRLDPPLLPNYMR